MSAATHSNTRTHYEEATGKQAKPSLPPVKQGSKMAAQLPVFFQLLLQRYQDVVSASKVLPSSTHGVFHYLQTKGPPIASPFR
jgi:hypothetical protein